MPESTRPGDVLGRRYQLVDLLAESEGGRFWRAQDSVLQRDVAVHIIDSEDRRADLLREAARTSATVHDRRILRVLDIDDSEGFFYVVNEWGNGTSLDLILAEHGPLLPRQAAWLVAEAAETVAAGHDAGVAHGRLAPENLLVDDHGGVKVIGFAVDAALHGLPPGRMAGDVSDLAGLLYAGLTGKWAGVSRSAVPTAPTEHGSVLRPRRVRAGIPRGLDALCDRVLNGGDAVPAGAIAHELRDFVGDDGGQVAGQLARLDRSSRHTTTLPPVPAMLPHDAAPETTTADEPEPVDEAPAPEPEPEEQPTQAGVPIFRDGSDDVEWFAPRPGATPPPPPFDDPPERPLFAPEPTDGGPARRARAGVVTTTPPPGRTHYWPWEQTGTGHGTGSGVIPAVDDEDEEDDGVPGRSMLRLAALILTCLLLAVAIVIAFNLQRGRTPLGGTPSDPTSGPASPTDSGSASAGPLTGLTATDFDPQGDPPEENPEQAPDVVDGDPSTTWQTMRYDQNLGPGGIKTGVGVTIDLGGRHTVDEVDLTLVGVPTDLSLYVTDDQPSAVRDLTPAATATADGTDAKVTLDQPATGRYLTVWLTSLPQVPGGFRGEIAEVAVRGE